MSVKAYGASGNYAVGSSCGGAGQVVARSCKTRRALCRNSLTLMVMARVVQVGWTSRHLAASMSAEMVRPAIWFWNGKGEPHE